jgi:NDP-sugar pyrophosphorylase family protein
MSEPVYGLILAGGLGTRLKPLTDHVPKPLVLLNGKPIVEYTFDLFKRYGITHILLSIGHKADMIKKHYGTGRKYGLHITYLKEDQPLGTAGPLTLGKKYLTSTFIMSNGDELKDINLQDMLQFHQKNHAQATIALTTVADPSQYGVARMHNQRILEFIEKPAREKAPSHLINSGLYILEPSSIDLVDKIPCSIERDVFPKLAAQQTLYGYSFKGQWFDTGSIERLRHTEKNWKGFQEGGVHYENTH